METNLKKLIPILGVACFSMASLSAAYDDGSSSSSSTNNSNNQGKMMAVPPSASPGDTGPNVFLSADYTLWTARQSGLAVALTNFYGAGTVSPDKGHVHYPEFKLRSGFKVDLGVYLPHDNWDLVGEYTWFYNKTNSFHAPTFTSGQAVNTWLIDPVNNTPATLSYFASRWQGWFQRVDVTMGRSFYAGHYLALRPFLGLLGAWDSQDFDINYQFSTDSTLSSVDNDQTWWGIGIYGGMDSVFTFYSDSCNQWSLFLDMGLSLPWSKFTTHQKTFDSAGLANLDFGGIFYTVAPMVENSLGLRWETWWSEGAWKFMLQAAWEEQVWFNHNNFVMPGSSSVGSGNGAYTMQGLTVKAVLAF